MSTQTYVALRCLTNRLECATLAIPRTVFNRVSQHATLCPNGDWAVVAPTLEAAIGPWLQLPGVVVER